MTLQTSKYLTPMTSMVHGRAFGDTPAYTAQLMDADGEYVVFTFRVPKTGNIRTLSFRTGTVTTGRTLSGGLYTVLATGSPSTTTAYGGMVAGTVAVADTDDNVVKTITLGTDASATEGDFIAFYIQFNGSGTVGNLNIQSFGVGVGTSGVWLNGTRQSTNPILAVGYDDGSYEPIVGVVPFTGGVASTSFNVNTATFDEYALKFSVPFKCRLRGVRVGGSFAAGADIEVINYNGTSAVTGMTLTVDGDTYGTTNREHVFLWTTTEELAANTTRYLSIRPTTTANFTLSRGTTSSTAAMDMLDGNLGWQSAKRLNQGAWDETETTIMPFIMPIFDQLDDGASTGTGTGSSGPALIGL